MIYTSRFVLIPLTAEHATPVYCAWLDDALASKYIESAQSDHSVESLRAYIHLREHRADVLFLGIFADSGRRHIGNIKYEPINTAHGYAVMGLLIGEKEWRGRGVAQEVIGASAAWLRRSCGIREIIIGVASENLGAIRAYEKAGFRREVTERINVDSAVAFTMVLHLEG